MSVAELLQKLVQIPSINPDNAGGSNLTGEANLAEYLRDWLTNAGADVQLEEVLPGRPNLIARFAPHDGRPRILFGPHLDTVGIDGMTIDPFAAEIVSSKIYGRGTSDTKGSMACMLMALLQNAPSLSGSAIAVDFVALMGEESSQWGSKHFAANHADEYEFAIVGEPTSLDVVHTTKGSLWATLRAHGQAAHSSQPHLGENAVLKLARALDTLEKDIVPKLKVFEHSVLGCPTFNVGAFHGGSRPNVVPDHAEALVDIRITPELQKSGGALNLLQQSLADLGIELSHHHENCPMEIDPHHPWIHRIQKVRPQSKTTGAPWFSDAAHLSAAGIPSVCMGPGSIDQAHTADEFIELAALEEGALFFEKFVAAIVRG